MRIQEMKSGFLHLKKKMENDRSQNYSNLPGNDDVGDEQEAEHIQPWAADCELDKPLWSVVSFDKIEAGGLTYVRASELMDELNSHGITGLCIVTDEASSRMRS